MDDAQTPRRRGRPSGTRTGVTPKRDVRVPESIWQPAKTAAAAQGETVSAVVVRALARYVSDFERAQAALDRRRAEAPVDGPTWEEAMALAAEEEQAQRRERRAKKAG